MLISYGPARNRIGITWLFFILATLRLGMEGVWRKPYADMCARGPAPLTTTRPAPQRSAAHEPAIPPTIRAALPQPRNDRPVDATMGVRWG